MAECKTCKYRAAADREWTCEYILITGHSRNCAPDMNCTVYERGCRVIISNNITITPSNSDINSLNYFLNKFNHYNG